MPAPTIDTLPPAPNSSMPEAEFDAAATLHVNSLNNFVSQLNLLVAWMNANVSGQPKVVVSATSHNILAANSGAYHFFTNDSAKTANVDADVVRQFPNEFVITGENEGSSDLTIVPAVGVTIRPPLGGTLVVPSGGAFTLIRTGVDSFKLIGDTVAA